MATKKKGLGKGLDSLLGSTPIPLEQADTENTADRRTTLPIDAIKPGPYQPRSIFDEAAIDTLAESIEQHGVIQPIVVRPCDDAATDTRYEIIAGERRWRASQVANLDVVPVIIKTIDHQSALAVALIENIQREDLNAIEEAHALQKLHTDYQLTHAEVGKAVGRSRTSVSNLIRLLDLHQDVQQAVLEKTIDMGHARALLACEASLQPEIAKQVSAKGLSVRETEALVKNYLNTATSPHKSSKKKDPDVIALEQQLSEKLGSKVNISANHQGVGKITINFRNLDVLDGIIQQLT